MIDHNRRVQLADDLLRRFAAALKGAQLYTASHPLVTRNTEAFAESLALVIGQQRSLTLGVVGGEFVVGDVPVPKASGTMSDLLRRLRRAGVERIVIDRDVPRDEIAGLVAALAALDRHLDQDAAAALPALPHIQVGRIQVAQRVDTSLADTAAIRAAYKDAATLAERLWEQSLHEGRPDPGAARGMVDNLAQAVAQNRTALIALTALKNYDNYTFTHMVNVSILTMAQARALGIDGPLLREFGLAGLMHDIGKVRTPNAILNKPDALDRCRVHDHEAARPRRGRDSAQDAGGAADCPRRRLRASPPPGRDGISRDREAPAAEPGHRAVLDRGRLRRDAIAAQVPAVVPDRTHQGRARTQRRPAVRSAISFAGSCSCSASIRRQPW